MTHPRERKYRRRFENYHLAHKLTHVDRHQTMPNSQLVKLQASPEQERADQSLSTLTRLTL